MDENILIADDEEAIQKLLAKFLQKEGYRLFTANNGKEAVDIVKKNPVDLAILDMIMPEMDGVEALRQIKVLDPTIEVLMITGKSNVHLLRKVLFEYGAYDYLLKPFDMVELKLTVQRALHVRKLAQQSSHVMEEMKNRIVELENDFKEKTFRLRESQIKYKNIVENSTDAIVVIQDGYVKFANRIAMELSGYSQQEILAIPFPELLHPEDRTEAVERYNRKLGDDDLTPTNILRVLKRDGTFIWVENQSVKSLWQDKPATLNFMRDLTRRRKIEEAMARSEKLVSLGQLSAGLAHELRNPLAVISSCSQFCLENKELESLVKENFQVILRSSRRASNLISELLAFARPDHLEWKEVDLNEVVTKMLRMAELGVNTYHMTFSKRFQKGLPKIICDEEKLGQVIVNLLQNAIQATAGKGEIVLETACSALRDRVEVNIVDSGPGIPEEYRPRVFDPFFTTKDGGTGLGLSICHTIVDQHQGSISIECGEKKGTRVSVTLPVNQDSTGMKGRRQEKMSPLSDEENGLTAHREHNHVR